MCAYGAPSAVRVFYVITTQIERDVVPCGVYHQLEFVRPDRFQLKSTRCEAGAILPHDLQGGCEAGAVYRVIYGAGARRVRGGCDFTPLFARRVRGGCEAGAVYVVIYRAGAHTPFGVLKL